MKILKFIILTFLILSIVNVFKNESQNFIPISISETATTKKLSLVGIRVRPSLVGAIDFASTQYDLSPEFIIALILTESSFDENAVSSKGYKGLMQIPQKVPSDANILVGANIFREKMRIVEGDLVKALCLYKGYKIGSGNGLREANKVLFRLRQIKKGEMT